MANQGYSVSKLNAKEKHSIYEFLKCTNPNTKTQHHNECKQYRNWLSTLIRESKQKYFNNYFHNNVKNITNNC